MPDNPYTVGIVGAGSIGALKPDNIDSPSTEFSLTHAHAVHRSKDFKLNWIFDVDVNKMKQASKKWDCLGIQANQYGEDYNFEADIIIIASPTETHMSIIDTICNEQKVKPKLIILEKPAGSSLLEATRIDYMCSQAGIPIIVNYGRRFSRDIQLGVFAMQKQEIQSIVFYYTRGLIRDGSHALDFINWIAGNFVGGEIINTPPIFDYSKEDPTYAVRLEHQKCRHIFLVPVDGRIYDCFEAHILTNYGRWVFDDHFLTMSLNYSRKEETYGNYFSLPSIKTSAGEDSFIYRTDLKSSLDLLYQDAVNVLDHKTPPVCGMQNALKVHNILDRLFMEKEMRENE